MPQREKKSWREKVLQADRLWAQLKKHLEKRNLTLPQTPRRPDIRMIIENVSGVDQLFRNPGDHSNSKAEHIPAKGDKCATMIMLEGENLEEQYEKAQKIYSKYKLSEKGLSKDFVEALQKGDTQGLIREAYGPAPFKDQTGKLSDLEWGKNDGSVSKIKPVFGKHTAFGARPASDEMVFAIDVEIFVKGSDTTPEKIESAVMFIAISEDWETGAQSTRPIVPSVAMEFYGRHYEDIPSVLINPAGKIKSIDLKNGTFIDLYPDHSSNNVPKQG